MLGTFNILFLSICWIHFGNISGNIFYFMRWVKGGHIFRQHSKFTLNLIFGYNEGKVFQSLQCTQHVPTGFRAPSPPVYAANPSQEHLDKALYVCRYLVGTSKYCLTYDRATGEGLSACTDSNWASNPDG